MVVHDLRAAQRALLLRRLLLEDVAREGVPAAHLAGAGDFEALLRAGMGLHLGHDRERTIMTRPCPRRHPRRARRAPRTRSSWPPRSPSRPPRRRPPRHRSALTRVSSGE